MADVSFDHVDKVYPGGTAAVTDFDLHVAEGELVVFVGPSGCGKSTLLRLLAGLEQPTGGALRIGGRVVNDLPPQERNVAMVFQDYALYPFLSVRRNLEFPLRMRKLGREDIRRRVEAAAQMLDIAHLLDRLPRQLSGGQRQRVAMGRALVREPTVFLLDEPLSNLDAKLRVQVRAEIADLQQRTGTTMIYVTHDQVEAMTLGHRVAVLHQGRLRQAAPPRELYDHPASTFVAGFIGNPPMNLFPTRIAMDSGGTLLLTVGDQPVRLAANRFTGTLPVGRALTAGIRPEALFLVASDSPPTGVVANVEHTEHLGHETLVHARVAPPAGETVRLIARLEGTHPLAKGERVRLGVREEQIHLFDADGAALQGPPPA